jgi:hypothetical protein
MPTRSRQSAATREAGLRIHHQKKVARSRAHSLCNARHRISPPKSEGDSVATGVEGCGRHTGEIMPPARTSPSLSVPFGPRATHSGSNGRPVFIEIRLGESVVIKIHDREGKPTPLRVVGKRCLVVECEKVGVGVVARVSDMRGHTTVA